MEVELTAKAPERLVRILEAWQARKMRNPRGREMIQPSKETPHWILYICAPKVVSHVKRAVKKAGADWCASVQELWFDHSPSPDLRASLAAGQARTVNPRRGSGRSPLTAAPPPLLSRPGRVGVRFGRGDLIGLARGTCGMFDSLRWRCAERCRGWRHGEAVVRNGCALCPT